MNNTNQYRSQQINRRGNSSGRSSARTGENFQYQQPQTSFGGAASPYSNPGQPNNVSYGNGGQSAAAQFSNTGTYGTNYANNVPQSTFNQNQNYSSGSFGAVKPDPIGSNYQSGGYNNGYNANYGSNSAGQNFAQGNGGGDFANAMGQFGQAAGVNPAVMAMGAAATTKLVDDTMKNFAPMTANVSGFWGTLKFYFSVDNNYVVRKLALLLFPVRQTNWSRVAAQGGSSGTQGKAPPISDINCPDLYIPVMAFVTYILLLGLFKGTEMSFTPEVLSDTFSSSITTQFIEVLVIYGGNASIGDAGGSYSWTELVIYTGYKYVGVALTLLGGMIAGYTGSVVISVYASLCSAYVLVRWLSSEMPDPLPKRSKTLLLGLSVLEFIIMNYLGLQVGF